MLTPILLINKKGPLRCYCTAILLSFGVLIILHLLFNALRPGFYDGSNISPLIYNVPVLDNIAQSIYGYDTTSFPSIHITLSFTALMIVLRTSGMRKWSWALSALVALMVFSVIYLGMHWPLDVLVGLAIGYSAAMASEQIYPKDDRSADIMEEHT